MTLKEAKEIVAVVHITIDDWEGVYLDGVLHDEAHTLGEGESDYYWLKLAEEKGFKLSDIRRVSANDELNDMVNDKGYLPTFFSGIGHMINEGK